MEDVKCGQNVHAGHRKRLRATYIAGEARGNGAPPVMNEHQLLELLLTYAMPRIDVNPIAHALIDRFGSLERVLTAPLEELTKVDGIGESAAVLISLTGTLKSLSPDVPALRERLNTPEEAARYCKKLFVKCRYETTYCISLDKRRRVLHADPVSTGTLSENVVYPRLVAEFAIRHGASSIILTHNHPSGDASPSRADVESTKAVCDALSGIGITLHDHIIVGGEGVYSMQRNSLLRSGVIAEPVALAAEKEE